MNMNEFIHKMKKDVVHSSIMHQKTKKNKQENNYSS
jgi:hypothetical protein